jgi:hypothetical protein
LGFLTLSSRDPHESYRIVSSYHVGVVWLGLRNG